MGTLANQTDPATGFPNLPKADGDQVKRNRQQSFSANAHPCFHSTIFIRSLTSRASVSVPAPVLESCQPLWAIASGDSLTFPSQAPGPSQRQRDLRGSRSGGNWSVPAPLLHSHPVDLAAVSRHLRGVCIPTNMSRTPADPLAQDRRSHRRRNQSIRTMGTFCCSD